MRAVLSMVLVGLVVCVGCEREPDAVSHEPIQPEVSKETVSPEPPSPKLTPEEVAGLPFKDFGGSVQVDNNGAVVSLTFHRAAIDIALGKPVNRMTNAALVHLKELTNLQIIDLRNTNVTDAGLVHLKGLTSLEVLSLESKFSISFF